MRDIDGWFRRILKQLTKLLAAAWRAIRRLTGMYLEDHALAEGRTVEPRLAEWVTDQVLTNLRVSGPVTFKEMIDAGHDEQRAKAVMSSTIVGAAQKIVLRGDRDTVMRTVEESGEIVGWRRVSDGDPCHWCAMLISRGAVYKTSFSATRVVGQRGNQILGASYHDHDGCTAEPLYEHEDEPAEVQQLYAAWVKATAGKSGVEALRAWRTHYDSIRSEISTEREPSEPRTAPETPSLPDVPQPAASPFYRSLDGLGDLAEFARAAGEAERKKLYGGQSAKVELVILPDGRRAVSKRAEDWGDTSPESAADVRHSADAEQLAYLLGRAIGAPVAQVYRDTDEHIWVEYVEGSPDDVSAAMLNGPDGIRLGLLDVLSAGVDRNGGNMIERNGALVGIDQGENWRPHNLDPDRPRVGSADQPMALHFADEDATYKDNPLTPSDVEAVRRRVEVLRPDFELLDHADWLDYALAVLDRLAPHAKGARPLYDE